MDNIGNNKENNILMFVYSRLIILYKFDFFMFVFLFYWKSWVLIFNINILLDVL